MFSRKKEESKPADALVAETSAGKQKTGEIASNTAVNKEKKPKKDRSEEDISTGYIKLNQEGAAKYREL